MSNEGKKVDTKKSVNVESKKAAKTGVTSKKNEPKRTTKSSSATKNAAKSSTKGDGKSTNASSNKKTSVVKKKNIDKSKVAINLEEADSFYHVSLLAQATCVIGILAISILAIFENSFTIPIEVLVGITLLIMAYNNSKLFKRKGLTRIYVVFGIISLIVGILGYFGVTV